MIQKHFLAIENMLNVCDCRLKFPYCKWKKVESLLLIQMTSLLSLLQCTSWLNIQKVVDLLLLRIDAHDIAVG